jgi:hypothetical protein
MGQRHGDYQRRLIMVGGDGLTFEKLHQIKKYMQFHDDPFEKFEVMEPALESWHTEWTSLSCAFETHWGCLLSDDPATLGYTAHKIDQPEPANLAKVDYYPSAEFTFLTLDMRMLDCWRCAQLFSCSLRLIATELVPSRIGLGTEDLFGYFKNLAALGKLPEFEDLELLARKLY